MRCIVDLGSSFSSEADFSGKIRMRTLAGNQVLIVKVLSPSAYSCSIFYQGSLQCIFLFHFLLSNIFLSVTPTVV